MSVICSKESEHTNLEFHTCNFGNRILWDNIFQDAFKTLQERVVSKQITAADEWSIKYEELVEERVEEEN